MTEGTARIVALDSGGGGGPDDGEAWPWEGAIEMLRKPSYELELEVSLPGRESYRVKGRFKAPRGTRLSRGLELPVKAQAEDPAQVTIDWDRFADDPNREQALSDARDSRQAEVMSAQIAKKPKQQQKMWASSRAAIPGWIEAVKLGNVSREQIESQIRTAVDSGSMDPADGEAGLAELRSLG